MAFVVSSGQIAGLDRSAALAAATVRLSSNFSATYEAIWKAQPEVRTVVGFLARNIAQINIHTFERISDVDRQRLTDHPVAQLLSRPNPKTSRYRFIESLVSDLGIYDNAIWLKSKTSDGVNGLVRLPPAQVTPVGDSWMWAEAYRFQGSRGHQDFKPEDIVHFRGYNPSDARWGVSPMESLRAVLAEAHESAKWREQLWRNGARIPGWITRPPKTPWADGARERFRADWKGLYTGDGPAAGGTPVLEDGMDFHTGGITPKDAEYVASRKLTREEVASAYFIPPPMVGILDHATFSNIKEQHQNLYQDTLGPWLKMITEELALQLIPDLDDTGRVYVEFNMAEKMQGSFEEQATSLQTAVGGPWLTRNEARARQNLPRLDGADELIVPLNVLEGGQASPTDSVPKARMVVLRKDGSARVKAVASEEHEERTAEVFRKFFARQKRVVMIALGAKASTPDWWDTARWNDELAEDLYKLAVAVTAELGPETLKALGLPDAYDVDRTLEFLKAVAEFRAELINDVTLRQLQDLGEDEAPADVFEKAETSRALQAGITLATTLAGFAATEAVKQQDPKATKTWVVNSGNPRPSHARMAGQTVEVGERFSNGAQWPGDRVLGVDGVAGCTCTLEMEV